MGFLSHPRGGATGAISGATRLENDQRHRGKRGASSSLLNHTGERPYKTKGPVPTLGPGFLLLGCGVAVVFGVGGVERSDKGFEAGVSEHPRVLLLRSLRGASETVLETEPSPGLPGRFRRT